MNSVPIQYLTYPTPQALPAPILLKDKNHKRIQLLSIDGGGVKGLIPLRIIMELVKRTNMPVHELWDGFAGTSAGSIILNALLIPGDKRGAKYTPEDLWNLIDHEFPKIFKQSFARTVGTGFGFCRPLYGSKVLEHTIQKICGEALFKDQLRDVLAPAFSMRTYEPRIFNRHQARMQVEKSALKVSEVVLASCSVPALFPPYQLGDDYLIDGATYANNPAILAYCQARELLGDESDIHMLSIGCGAVNHALRPKHFIHGGRWKWFPRLIEIFLSGTEKVCNHIATKLLCKNYERIEVPLELGHERLEDVSSNNMLYLKKRTEWWIETHSAYLDSLCQALVAGRKPASPDMDIFPT